MPQILLAVILIAFIGTLIAKKKVIPLQIGLLILGLICAMWYYKTLPKSPTSIDVEVNRHRAIGYMLCKEALEELRSGDEILLLTTSLPAWKSTSDEMQEGVRIALSAREGVTLRTLDITTLPDGNRVDADGALMLKAAATDMQGSDALLTAFPTMGEWTAALPKLPPAYVYYDGLSNNWQTLIKRKRLKAVAVSMIGREDRTTKEVHPLEVIFRQEYVLANEKNVAEVGGFR